MVWANRISGRAPADAKGRLRRAATALVAGAALLLAACGAPAPQPALWRIADADSEIWLFGTIHVLPADLEWRSPEVDAAFDAADTVIFETDISDSPAGARLRQVLLERGLDRSGETLSMKIGAADWALLDRVARRLGAAPAAFEPFMPWFAAMQLSSLYVQSIGQSFEVGVERVLDEEARAAGKRLDYLETPEEHVAVLADLPAATQIAFLRATLEQLEAAEDDIAAIDRAWVRGDVDDLERLLNEEIEDAGQEAASALLTDRNARWRDRILTMLEGEGRIFIAVGAAHLIGDDSVIAMLRARGVAVEGP
ncbi:MAG: TraB/GumN family protein [Alphaproteobacteria bacterium]|nr:TraB/GumN family protein [Alphaproteobacteria bacterium]